MLRAWRWIKPLPSPSLLTGEPRGSRGGVSGVINGQEFGMASLNTSVRQEARSGVTTIWSGISHIPASVGKRGPEPLPAPGPLRLQAEAKRVF